jgi:hypothetical protein
MGLPAWNDPRLNVSVKRPRSTEEIRRGLEENGYYEVRDIVRQGSFVTATARHCGKYVRLQLNLDTGAVVESDG